MAAQIDQDAAAPAPAPLRLEPKDPVSRAILARLRAREARAVAILESVFDEDAEARALSSLFAGESETVCRAACEAERPGQGRFEKMKARWREMASPGDTVRRIVLKLGDCPHARPTYIEARLECSDESVCLLFALFENIEAEDLHANLDALRRSYESIEKHRFARSPRPPAPDLEALAVAPTPTPPAARTPLPDAPPETGARLAELQRQLDEQTAYIAEMKALQARQRASSTSPG